MRPDRRLGDAASTRCLRALVAVGHPLPVELLLGLDGSDLSVALSRFERDGLLRWNDDGMLEATELATAEVPLTHAERAALRGLVGRAALGSPSLPIDLVAGWLLEGCAVTPDPTVIPALLRRATDELRRGQLTASADVLRQVVRTIERGRPATPLDRVRAYVGLGDVLRWLGRTEEAAGLRDRALAVARESGEPAALAAAALAWHTIAVADDPAAVALVDEALGIVGASDVAVRGRLLAARAEGLLFVDLQAATATAAEALECGRASGDAETLVTGAYAYRVARWHPSRQAEALRLGTEMVAAAPRVVDHPEHGAMTRLQVFLETGDWPHFDGELAAMGRRLAHAPRPLEVLWYQVLAAARAQTRGHWDEADRLVASSLTIAGGPEHGPAFQLLLTQQVLAAWHRGQSLVPLVGYELLPAGPMRTSWEACLLGWTCEHRSADEVGRELDRLLVDGIESVRPDLTFGPVTSSLAMAAARVGSRDHAATLLAALLPYADQWAGTGGAVVNGPFALHLGRLAAVLGRCDEAAALLETARRSAVAGGCTPWEARVMLALAELATDPAARARDARRAAALAGSVGMTGVVARARVLLGKPSLPAGLTSREADVLRMLAGGATNAEIAERLYLSVKTVERHVLNAYRKAGVRNRAEAAAFTLRELGD